MIRVISRQHSNEKEQLSCRFDIRDQLRGTADDGEMGLAEKQGHVDPRSRKADREGCGRMEVQDRVTAPSDRKPPTRVASNQGVTGYAQSLLVMEQFGYPDFLVATADELIEQQYADRLEL